jgi:drug/metabolite transporter (DMT)-like permease
MRALGPNLQGVLWMVTAMAAFSLEDAFIKRAPRVWPGGQVLITFGLLGALCFAAAARRSRTRLLVPEVLSPAMRVRACFELVGRLFYVLAVALTPLSATTVILQATPVLVVLGGSLVFKERVGWRRWAAVVAVLVGVLAYAALMKAMRTGDIATVTPFRYTRLVFGVGLGVLVFGERLDAGMVLGSVVIALAGLLIAWDGRRRG